MLVRLAIPVAVIAALGVVIVVSAGWGGLWLYGLGVVMVVFFLLVATRGGEIVQTWSRGHFRDRM